MSISLVLTIRCGYLIAAFLVGLLALDFSSTPRVVISVAELVVLILFVVLGEGILEKIRRDTQRSEG